MVKQHLQCFNHCWVHPYRQVMSKALIDLASYLDHNNIKHRPQEGNLILQYSSDYTIWEMYVSEPQFRWYTNAFLCHGPCTDKYKYIQSTCHGPCMNKYKLQKIYGACVLDQTRTNTNYIYRALTLQHAWTNTNK